MPPRPPKGGVGAVPLKYLKAFDEARIVFKPYPGLLILDASMLERVREMMLDQQFAEQFEVAIVPKMM
jgi:hypothetical protein